jgi:hypothetical protein
MSKFAGFLGKGKGMVKNIANEAIPILAVTAGVVGAQKFLDFKTLLPNAKPDAFYMKHEGLVKLGGAILLLSLPIAKKIPMPIRFVIAGIGVQGGIKAVRQYTMNDAGKSFVDQIGKYDDEINEAAEKIRSFAANTSNTSVSGGPDTSRVLQANSQTGVAGMGMNDYDYAA